jgi:hypothetical protein
MEQAGKEEVEHRMTAKTPARQCRAGVFAFLRVLCDLPVYPRVHVALFPSEMLSYPVSGKSPFPPFVAHGALWDSEYRGYVAR